MAWNDDIKRIMAIVPQIEELQRDLDNPEKPLYNELEIKSEIKKLKSSVSKLSDELLSIKRSESSARTHQELAENFEAELLLVKSRLNELNQQNVTITSKFKEYVKIDELLNAVKERDETIETLKLNLKRAESSARNCEELMINMERRLDELSARLNNGN